MPETDKLDLFKKYKDDYVAPKAPVLLKIRPAFYLSITGKGAPGSDTFQDAIGALYGVAFTIKMTRKVAGRDYKIAPLEGLYWPKRKTADLCPGYLGLISFSII